MHLITRYPSIALLLLFLLGNGCSTDPPDPVRALPSASGIALHWTNGTSPIPTGFADLDTSLRNLVATLPPRDSAAEFSYAAFAYNLRPGVLGAGLAVAGNQIVPPSLEPTDVDYRGIPLFRTDSGRGWQAAYAGLVLTAPEAVIIQEMIDQLLDGKSTVDFTAANQTTPPARQLWLNPRELAPLLSTQATAQSRERLAQWGEQWQAMQLDFSRDRLAGWQLTPRSSRSFGSVLGCLTSIPAGTEHFALLPVPTGGAPSRQPSSATWQTYFAPWIGNTYARIATEEGSILAFCAEDPRLMRDLLDRLEREFAVAERVNYPNGTILASEAPGLSSAFYPSSDAAGEAWLLRTSEQTYLSTSRAALEQLLDRLLLAGPILLPPALTEEGAPPALVARLSPDQLTADLKTAFPGWTAPRWLHQLDGWWFGKATSTGIHLTAPPNEGTPVTDPATGTPPNTSRVAWRWEAPAEIERVLPAVGSTDCGVFLQDGSLIVLDDRQRVKVRTALGAAPNSPLYHLPRTPEVPERWLFSTPGAVHLIDTSGRPRPGFPYRPAGGLATGVLLDALDRATDPAYFVPLRSGRIEAYSLRGLPLVNWTPPTEFTPAEPLLTLYSDTSTYLVAVDSLSRVRVYDRRGAVYLAFDSLPAPLIGPIQGQLSPAVRPGRLASLELDGRVRVMSLAGGHFPLRVLTARGAPRQLLFTDLWGDSRNDYLVSRDDALALYAYRDNEFSQRWQTTVPARVDRIFSLDALRLVGGLNQDRGLLYLLEGTTGKLLDANGLAGQLPGQELTSATGDVLLVTAYRRTLYAYQIAR
jgi:hypothetical protein